MKKKPVLPRTFWSIRPVTRVKGSAKAYDRNKVKSNTRREGHGADSTEVHDK